MGSMTDTIPRNRMPEGSLRPAPLLLPLFLSMVRGEFTAGVMGDASKDAEGVRSNSTELFHSSCDSGPTIDTLEQLYVNSANMARIFSCPCER